MSTSTSRLFIVQCKLILSNHDNYSLDDFLRRAVYALGSFDGADFVPQGKHAASFLEGKTSAHGIALTHPGFTEAKGYTNSWLSISADSYGKGSSVIFAGIHIGKPGEQMGLEWSIGLTLMPRLVMELTPILGFMNGKLVDIERTVLPGRETLPKSSVPLCFTPWTYFDQSGLNADMMKRLALLPAPLSSPLARGWVVQALEKIDDPVRPEFLSALAELNDPPIRYIQPILEMR